MATRFFAAAPIRRGDVIERVGPPSLDGDDFAYRVRPANWPPLLYDTPIESVGIAMSDHAEGEEVRPVARTVVFRPDGAIEYIRINARGRVAGSWRDRPPLL
jgi:hypothetical protein